MTNDGNLAYWRSLAVDALLEVAALREPYNDRSDRTEPDLTPDPSGPNWSVNERDIAFSLTLRDLLQLPRSDAYRGWRDVLAELWDGASPEEAFIFNLSIARNHGDGSDIPYLPDEELRTQLEIGATRPTLTKWSARRILQLTDEAKRRRLAS